MTQPRGTLSGYPIQELHGWRILCCSDGRRSWVEVEPPKGAIEMSPARARQIAAALMGVADYTSDVAVRHFMENDR